MVTVANPQVTLSAKKLCHHPIRFRYAVTVHDLQIFACIIPVSEEYVMLETHFKTIF